jgi:AAA+ ATPase superfamily predicted ATPase
MTNAKKLGRGYGNWVRGDQFYDRTVELALFAKLMSQGNHLLIVAPRRIGKTSLMREAEARLKPDYLCLQVDLQKASSPADAVLELSLATRAYLPL